MYLMRQAGISACIRFKQRFIYLQMMLWQKVDCRKGRFLKKLNIQNSICCVGQQQLIMNVNKNCTLHRALFQYFCDQCFEPVCKQCTIIGPHHTQIHSITTIASAYERRLHQIQARIASFIDNKSHIALAISNLNLQIEQLKSMKELNMKQNEIYRSRMLNDLQKCYERISSQIDSIKEEFQIKLSQINDLGHSFQQITDQIQMIASQGNILQSMKQCSDRLSLLLDKNYKFEELPKELSDLRLKLKNIQVYNDLIHQKAGIIQAIFINMDKEKQKIEQPTIEYPQLMNELSANMNECIEHNVCHYCGLVFSFESVNTVCSKNNSNLDINSFGGFCSKKPDSSKWATRRHYFSEPGDNYSYYVHDQDSSFKVHLSALLLRLKTICIIQKINLKRNFESTDKAGTQKCDKISMLYTLMEICGLKEDQSQILLRICKSAPNSYCYPDLLSRLDSILI